jgi:hypothetical protein
MFQPNQHQPVVHRTVLSAQAGPAANSTLSGKSEGAATIIHQTVWCAPDCPVCTGLSGEPNGPRPTVVCAINGRHVAEPTVGWSHWTVSGAPRGPREHRSASPEKEGDRAPDMNCSCLVVHRTVRCTTRHKARIAFLFDLQRLLAALGL